MKGTVKAISATIVFEASAVNRDENIGGNIQSLKKLRREDGVYTFFSRAFLRHHLFNALVKKYGWKPAKVLAKVRREKVVVQFNVLEDSILSSEELDFFGYMYTDGITFTRKAPVGMTKAVSLERWEGDMAFYANHDLVQRAREEGFGAEPNPFSKEEHLSLYKYSVTIDLERIGECEVMIPKEKEKENGNKKEKKKERGNKKGYEMKRIFGVDFNNLKAQKVITMEKGEIRLEEHDDFYKIKLSLKEEEKTRRIEQFLDVVLNGFEIHSSTESWSTSPLLLVVATTKIPVVIFDPYVRLSGKKIRLDLLENAFKNTNIEECRIWYDPRIVEGKVSEEAKVCSDLKELAKWCCTKVKEAPSNGGT